MYTEKISESEFVTLESIRLYHLEDDEVDFDIPPSRDSNNVAVTDVTAPQRPRLVIT